MPYTYPGLFIANLETIHSNLDVDLLFVFSARLDRHLELLEGVLTHSVPASLLHLQDSNQLAFECLALSDELLLVTTSP